MGQQPKRKITDTYIRSRKPAASGDRDITPDADAPGLALSVTERGHKSFVLIARFPPSKHPAKRALGDYPALTLEAAREKAGAWRALIKRGIDPRDEERQRLADEDRRRTDKREKTFGAAAEIYIQRKLKNHRRGKDSEREIRKELMSRWANRSLDEITRADVIAMVDEIVDRGAPEMARHALGHSTTFFNWCIDRGLLEHSPCDRVHGAKLIGAKKPRQRVFNDDELSGLWRASGRLGYPYKSLFRLLMLTGTRKNEAAGARWREIDLEARLWTIPAERFKSDSTHTVPLSSQVVAELECVPRFNDGDYLFSTTFGNLPVSGFGKLKPRLDRLIAEELGTAPPPWVVHDVRRTVRTRLSALRVPDAVAEMVIGHGRKGIQRVYDQHQYIDEMREALDAWARLLQSVVEPQPAPSNVVRLRGEA